MHLMPYILRHMKPGLHCRDILLGELNARKAKNSFYSMRAFARDLGIGSTSLSDVLAGKRVLSKKNIEKVVEKLNLSPEQKFSMEREGTKNQIDSEEFDKVTLAEDTFRLISEWYYLAILNLAKIPESSSDAKWVAERLGLELTQAEQALERLFRMGLIIEREGRLQRTASPLQTSREVPSSAIQNHHAGNLELAKKSLDKTPVHLKDFSSTTMAIDTKNLPAAKELLLKTKRKLAKLLENDQPDQVYTFTYQLFPLTELADEEINRGITQ